MWPAAFLGSAVSRRRYSEVASAVLPWFFKRMARLNSAGVYAGSIPRATRYFFSASP